MTGATSLSRAERRHQDREYRATLAHRGDRAVVGYLSPGEVDACFHESLLAMFEVDQVKGAKRLRCQWRIHGRSGANISRARNSIVREFLHLDGQPPWLLLVDTDMEWGPTALERLLAEADPERIVGGLCFAYGPEGRVMPTIFEADEHGRFRAVDAGYELPDRPTMLQVYGTGAAFILIHRDALVKIAKLLPASPNPWFREHEYLLPNPDHDPNVQGSLEYLPYWVSEDLFLCKQAHEAGLTVWVHTGVEVGHRKPHLLGRALYEQAPTLARWA